MAVRERYGQTVNGMSLLLARRLVEAEVPFITVFWKENEAIADKCKSAGGWDTHGNNFNCLKEHLLPEFDRGFSALIEDLAERGLLDQTLVLVTSEMGRKPKIGDPRSGGKSGAGRDHWTHCLTDVLAGGGIRGGQTYGASDARGEYPADKPLTPADITKTVYHAMGIHNLEATDGQGRPYNLLAEGNARSRSCFSVTGKKRSGCTAASIRLSLAQHLADSRFLALAELRPKIGLNSAGQIVRESRTRIAAANHIFCHGKRALVGKTRRWNWQSRRRCRPRFCQRDDG